ncbi:Cytochrome c551 peroxidase [hydrothermal vent metagenome]|uniref:Cytochrome c551 peroxidase n=1 Tax=hydrothermal vent metagenome TaxID=652676 RepID=A0A3B1BH27_9ZZZZ
MKKIAVLMIMFSIVFIALAESAQSADGKIDNIGVTGPVPVPENNPLTKAKIKLGKKLFFDDMLSGDGSMSCASCHDPDQGWTTHTRYSPAYPTITERRNSPTLVNTAYGKVWIWDGRAGSLDKQALGPMKNPLHMNQNPGLVVEEIRAIPEYVVLFKEAFDGKITPLNIGKALASFERTIISENSPFDKYALGDKKALGPGATKGLELFKGKAGCIMCHNGPNFTDNKFHNLGVPEPDDFRSRGVQTSLRFDLKRTKNSDWMNIKSDIGRATITKDKNDTGKFKTPTLRHVMETRPYMHNGVFESIEEVLAFYNAGGGDHPNKSPLVRPLDLSDEELSQLKAFLASLTGVIKY